MPPYIFTALWVVYATGHMVLWSYLSCRLNSDRTTALFWVTWLMGPLSAWPIVAMFSRNLTSGDC